MELGKCTRQGQEGDGVSLYNMDCRMNTLDNQADLQKIKSYLFQNNEMLRYMFSNLDPEDNYSSQALKKYIERDKKIATLEFDVNGLRVGIKNLEEETETKFELMDGKITLEVNNLKEEISTQVKILDGKITLQVNNVRKDMTSAIEVLEGKIELKVSVGEVSNQLSVETDGIKISGERLEIKTTNLTLTKDGRLSCVEGNFSGKIAASAISGGTMEGTKIKGGTITGSVIRAGLNWDVSNDACYMLYATNDSLSLGNFHVVEYGGRYIIESDDSWVGMSPEVSNKTGRVTLWANYHPNQAEDYDFVVSQTGNTRIKNLTVFNKVYGDFVLGALEDEYSDYSKSWHKVGYNIIRLWHRFDALEERVSALE